MAQLSPPTLNGFLVVLGVTVPTFPTEQSFIDQSNFWNRTYSHCHPVPFQKSAPSFFVRELFHLRHLI